MSFELNIENYKIKELEEIFDLPPGYNQSIIEMRENKLRENICSDTSISDVVRKQTLIFLQKAKDNLVNSIKNEIFDKSKSMNIYNTDTSLRASELISEQGSQFIIDRPDTPFSQSFPSEFYPGTINPLKRRSTRQYLNIDTRFRDNYYSTQSTNFHLDLPIKFGNVLSLQLATFEFKTSAFVISKQYGNNFFWLRVGSEEGAVIIPDGNYSPADLVTYLNNYIQNVAFTITTNIKNIQFSLNLNANLSGSEQIIVSYETGTADTPDFILDFQSNLQGSPDYGTPLPLKFGWLLGFRLGIYENNTTYVSEGQINLDGPKYFYLAIDDYNNNVNNGFYSAFNSSILNKNILARISYSTGNFVNVSQNNLFLTTTARQYFGPVDIQKLNIQLLDEYGRIIDLNNMDYSFCLTLQTVYDL